MTDMLTDGAAIAIRATDGNRVHVVSGRVDRHDSDDVTIREGWCWYWDQHDEKPIRKHRIQYMDDGEPKRQTSYRFRPRLEHREDGRLELIMYAAAYDGGRKPRYYAPHEVGPATEFETGELVAPREFLPDREVVTP